VISSPYLCMLYLFIYFFYLAKLYNILCKNVVLCTVLFATSVVWEMISNFFSHFLVSKTQMSFLLVTYAIIRGIRGTLQVITQTVSAVMNQSYLGAIRDVKVRLIWRPFPYFRPLFVSMFVCQYQRINSLLNLYEIRYKVSLQTVFEKS
jgi:hypothetical protein